MKTKKKIGKSLFLEILFIGQQKSLKEKQQCRKNKLFFGNKKKHQLTSNLSIVLITVNI